MSTPIGIGDPVRLLREQWHTPQALAEELYAMFTAKAPPVINEPLTIRVPEGQPAIRIERIQDGDTFVEGNRSAISKTTVSTAPMTPGRRAAPSPQEATRQPSQPFVEPTSMRQTYQSRRASQGTPQPRIEVPLIESVNAPLTFGGQGPVEFSTPPVIVSQGGQREPLAPQSRVTLRTRTPDQIVPPVGVITSGRGQVYQVALYNNGPIADPTGTITVTFTQLADDEILDPGMLIWDIRLYQGRYYGFVPIWG